MAKVTIQDVAIHAHVSKATVSRVLNGDHGVAEELRLRVQQAAEALGYQPNRAARRLKKKLNDVIGFLIPDISDPFFASMLRGAEDLAYEHGIGILPYSTGDDLTRQQVHLDMLEGERVAGLVIVPAPFTQPEMLLNMGQPATPFVLLDRYMEAFEADSVRVDNLRGSYAAIRHLINLGYTRIAMISGLPELSTGRERLQGYRLALSDAGLPADDSLVKPGYFRFGGGYQATQDLILLSNPPEAIFVANILMMGGCLTAIRDLKAHVPEEVALIGFDDLPLGEVLCPPLTVVSQPMAELGREAVRLLLQRIQNPEAVSRIVTLPTQLIVRESCGALLRGQGSN